MIQIRHTHVYGKLNAFTKMAKIKTVLSFKITLNRVM